MEYNLTPDEILNEIARIRKENNLPKDERVKELSKFEIDNLPSIPDNWKWVIINDISEFITNGVHTPTSTEDDNGFGLHCLRITDLKENGNIDYANLPYCLRIVEGDYDKKLKKDDIYFSFTGNNLGKRYIVKETREDTVFAHYFVRWHPILVDPYYIYYVTYSKIYDYFITANKHGSTQPNLKVMDLKRFPIPLCDLNIQRKISKILKNIDDKIEVNNKINDNLFELADTLYKNKILEKYEINHKLSEIYNFQYGKGNNNPDNNGVYPVYGSNGIIGGYTEFNNEDAPVIGHIGANCGSLIFAFGKHFVTYNGVMCKIKNDRYKYSGYVTMRFLNFKNEIRGSSQPFISYDLLNNMNIPLPNDKVLEEFENIIKPLFYKIKNNNIQNRELQQLRDVLLPKLMNGEIDLDKIEI